MIACGNVILRYKITGASKGPPPTLAYVYRKINYNMKRNIIFHILKTAPLSRRCLIIRFRH